MSAQTSALVMDNSTLTNFKAWAQAISSFFSTAGWVQTSDTGQVNWSTIASVPTAGNFVYEVWKPGDALTAYYVKIEYGSNSSSGSNPQMALTIGTATNGAGTLTGFVTTRQATLIPSANGGASVQYQCHFSGDTGRMCVMMWRDFAKPVFFALLRSKNSSGTNTSVHASILIAVNDGGSANQPGFYQTIVFGSGVTPANAINNSPNSVWPAAFSNHRLNLGTDNQFGNVTLFEVSADIGFMDNPFWEVITCCANDITEGCQYSIPAAQLPYGVSHNYLASKNGVFLYILNNSIGKAAILMAYE